MAGIIKAGDGGSGARARDGVGGNNTTDGSAPGVLTYGDGTGGDAGDPGSVQLYEDQNFENSSSNEGDTLVTIQRDALPTIAATDGSRGNDGWGGVNLTVYVHEKSGRENYSITDGSGYYSENIGSSNMYNNGKCVDAENPNQVTNYYTVYSKFEIGRKVSDERADKLNVITKNNDGGSTWYEICFSRNNETNKGWQDYTDTSKSIGNSESEFYARVFTSGAINAYLFGGFAGTIYQTSDLCVKIYVLPYPSNATSFSGANCFGL